MKEIKHDPLYFGCVLAIGAFVIYAFSGCSISLIGGRHINTYLYKSEGAKPEILMEAPSDTDAHDMLKAPLTEVPRIPNVVMPKIEDIPIPPDRPTPDDDPNVDFPTFPSSVL